MMRGLFLRANKLRGLLRRKEYRQALKHGIAAAVEHEPCLRGVKIRTLIDVGANLGQFSLVVNALHPGVVIHAFEPLAFIGDRFQSLFHGHTNVHLHRTAAGQEAMTSKMHVSNRPDSSSLLPISALQNQIFPGTAQATELSVNVARVDDILRGISLPEPIFIKLDVQGYELSALIGMPELLQKAKYVYSEVSFKELYIGQPMAHEVIKWLSNANFRLSEIYNLSFDTTGSAIQADVLFVRD